MNFKQFLILKIFLDDSRTHKIPRPARSIVNWDLPDNYMTQWYLHRFQVLTRRVQNIDILELWQSLDHLCCNNHKKLNPASQLWESSSEIHSLVSKHSWPSNWLELLLIRRWIKIFLIPPWKPSLQMHVWPPGKLTHSASLLQSDSSSHSSTNFSTQSSPRIEE